MRGAGGTCSSRLGRAGFSAPDSPRQAIPCARTNVRGISQKQAPQTVYSPLHQKRQDLTAYHSKYQSSPLCSRLPLVGPHCHPKDTFLLSCSLGACWPTRLGHWPRPRPLPRPTCSLCLLSPPSAEIPCSPPHSAQMPSSTWNSLTNGVAGEGKQEDERQICRHLLALALQSRRTCTLQRQARTGAGVWKPALLRFPNSGTGSLTKQ